MEKKEKILDIVDNMPSMNQAAFYSDPEVLDIVEVLHSRWEQNRYSGEPIDYASDEELEKLYRLAKYYSSLKMWEAYKIVQERSLKPRNRKEG